MRWLSSHTRASRARCAHEIYPQYTRGLGIRRPIASVLHDSFLETLSYDCMRLVSLAVLSDTPPMNGAQLREDSRFDSGIDIKLDFEGSHSFVCCPLLTSTGECMGVMQLVKAGLAQVSSTHINTIRPCTLTQLFRSALRKPIVLFCFDTLPWSMRALLLTRFPCRRADPGHSLPSGTCYYYKC
jgi:hypothetical protein